MTNPLYVAIVLSLISNLGFLVYYFWPVKPGKKEYEGDLRRAIEQGEVVLGSKVDVLVEQRAEVLAGNKNVSAVADAVEAALKKERKAVAQRRAQQAQELAEFSVLLGVAVEHPSWAKELLDPKLDTDNRVTVYKEGLRLYQALAAGLEHPQDDRLRPVLNGLDRLTQIQAQAARKEGDRSGGGEGPLMN